MMQMNKLNMVDKIFKFKFTKSRKIFISFMSGNMHMYTNHTYLEILLTNSFNPGSEGIIDIVGLLSMVR